MLDNIKEWWRDSSRQTRIGFSIGAVLIALLMVVATYWLFRSDYQVLFSDLTEQDASALVKELDKLKTPYEFANGGNTILVPTDIVYKTRLKVMGQNIPLQGGVGFEIFNNSDFGMTEFAQKVNYQRALQGELARTIMAFEEIKFARVHIVMPESGLFKKNKINPKASVTLIMKPDTSLRAEQIIGIQRLVAASVPEIEPNEVTVLDQHGVALSRNPRGEADENGVNLQTDLADNLEQRLKIKKQVEAHLTKKLAQVLDKALGPNQAIVSVNISLNYDNVKITKEDVLGTPGERGEITGVVIRRHDSTRNQTVQALDSAPHRSEGSRADLSPNESSSSEVDYQAGRRVEQVVSTPGSIRRISVGILVPNYQTEEKLRKLKEILQMAAGIDAGRGDAIAIHSLDQFVASSRSSNSAPSLALPSDTPVAMPTGKGAAYSQSKGLSQYVGYLSYALGCLLILAAGLAAYYRSRPVAALSPMGAAEREQMLRDLRAWLAVESAEEQKGKST